MTPEERYLRAKELFLAVCEMDAATRAEYLESKCADDAELRAEVDSLIAMDGAASDVESRLDPAAAAGMGGGLGLDMEGDPPTPRRLGKYEIVRVIGEGGMGVVYEAIQDQPRRHVALKVVALAITSREAMRRFRHEVELLGRLRHPDVAQIYEAGIHYDESMRGMEAAGLPYFAMELSSGKPITDFAGAKKLDVKARLRLIAKLCDAVQYAHQKGVIHRDLKPANILVDDKGHAKILDFGIARATDKDRQLGGEGRTQAGQLLGTLPYMSLEQLEGDPDDVDTRVDVYALGVIAYELLAGRLPLDVKGKTLAETVRILTESQPAALGSVNRGCRGDVETMVAKAMAKEKGQRYQTASDFAADIERFLRDEPIVARQASRMYHLRKFAKRNRVLVGSAAVVLSLLVIGTAAMSWLAWRAMREARRTKYIDTFMQEVLGSFDPATYGTETSLAGLLDRSAPSLDTGFPDQPDIEAGIRQRFGTMYYGLGMLDKAEIHLAWAYELRRGILRSRDPDLLESLHDLAVVRRDLGRFDEAEPMLRSAVEGYTKALGSDDPDTLSAVNSLAVLLYSQQRLDEAEPMFKETLDRRIRTLGEKHLDTLESMGNLGEVEEVRGRADEAERLMRRTLELRREVQGDPHRDTLIAMNNLADFLRTQNRFDEALSLLREAEAGFIALYGESNQTTLQITDTLASLLGQRGEATEAVEVRRRMVAVCRKDLGATNEITMTAMYRLAEALLAAGSPEESESVLGGLVADARTARPAGDWLTAQFEMRRGDVLVVLGRMDEAEAALSRSFEDLIRSSGPTDSWTIHAGQALATIYEQTGRAERAAAVRARFAAAPAGHGG